MHGYAPRDSLHPPCPPLPLPLAHPFAPLADVPPPASRCGGAGCEGSLSWLTSHGGWGQSWPHWCCRWLRSCTAWQWSALPSGGRGSPRHSMSLARRRAMGEGSVAVTMTKSGWNERLLGVGFPCPSPALLLVLFVLSLLWVHITFSHSLTVRFPLARSLDSE